MSTFFFFYFFMNKICSFFVILNMNFRMTWKSLYSVLIDILRYLVGVLGYLWSGSLHIHLNKHFVCLLRPLLLPMVCHRVLFWGLYYSGIISYLLPLHHILSTFKDISYYYYAGGVIRCYFHWHKQQSYCIYINPLPVIFKDDSTLPTLAPGIHLTLVGSVCNVTFLTIELPITRVFSSAILSVSEGKLIKHGVMAVRGLLNDS